MAIADRIEEMYTHVGDVYDTITNVELPEDKNIENIPRTIKDSYLEIMNNGTQQVWDNWEKVEGTGETLTLNNTEEAPMSLVYKGNTSQNGTPTPDNPVPIQVVSGDNSIVVSNGTQSTSYPITLPEGMFLGWIPNTTYQDKIDKSSGKNLFNLTATDFINGSTLGSAKKVEITLEPNTQYTLSSNTSGTSSATNIWFNGNDSSANGVFNGTPKTTTTDSNGKLFIAIRTSEISNIFANNWIMLNEGTTALEYEPYGTGWYVKKEIGKLNLSSIPFSAINTASTDTTRVTWYVIARNYQGDIALCDKLPYNINIWNRDTQGLAVSNSTGYVIVRINKSIVGTTEEEINTYLSNNDLIFYSPLATPTYTLIEDSTLISQLEALKSKTGQTNISQESNDMPFELDVEALKGDE